MSRQTCPVKQDTADIPREERSPEVQLRFLVPTRAGRAGSSPAAAVSSLVPVCFADCSEAARGPGSPGQAFVLAGSPVALTAFLPLCVFEACILSQR